MTKPARFISDDEIFSLYATESLPFLHPWQEASLQTFARKIEEIILRRQQILREHETLQNENYYRQLEAKCCDPNS